MKKRRNMIYRPSKGVCIMGGVMGIVFVVIGLATIVPHAGLFGILWTAMAGGISVYYFYMAFGKGTVANFVVEEEVLPDRPEVDAATRLEELRALYDQRLITQEEYEAKRKEIVKEL